MSSPRLPTLGMIVFIITTVVGVGVLPLAYTNPATEYNPFLYFDIDLARSVDAAESGNWLVSPSSVKSVLGLLLEGSVKRTAFEISQVLRLSPELNAARTSMYNYQQRFKSSDSQPGVEVKLANKLYTRRGMPIRMSYRSSVLRYFGAEAEESDFSNPKKLSKDINSWISDQTDNLIGDIVKPDQIKDSSQLLLINAVYFKGDWKTGFNPIFTRDDIFYTHEGKKPVKMMFQRGHFRYGEIGRLNAKIIELPYKNPRYSMVIVLPNENISVKRLISDLPYNPIVPILDSLQVLGVEVLLPRFSITYNVDLIPILQKLGVHEVFSDNADLSELLLTRGKVSSLLHQARIDVNENGTVAAATTVGNVELLTAAEKRRIVVNRPFVFFLRDTESGFLFEGQLTDPTQDQVTFSPNQARSLDLEPTDYLRNVHKNVIRPSRQP